MDPKSYTSFIDETIRKAPLIRRALLVYSQGGCSLADMEPAYRGLLEIGESARAFEMNEVSEVAASLAEEMRSYTASGSSQRDVNIGLELLSKLEGSLLKVSLDEQNFALELDDLIGGNFEIFVEPPAAPVAATTPPPFVPPPASLVTERLDPLEDTHPSHSVYELTPAVAELPQLTVPDVAAEDISLERVPQFEEQPEIQHFTADAWESDEFETDPELLEIFSEEAEGLLKNIETSLETLAGNPNDRDALWEIRRNAHTFKGSAGIVGLKELSELAHRVEDMLDRLVETNSSSNIPVFGLLHTSTTCLKALTAGETSPELSRTIAQLHSDFDGLLAKLDAAPIPIDAVNEVPAVAESHEAEVIAESPIAVSAPVAGDHAAPQVFEPAIAQDIAEKIFAMVTGEPMPTAAAGSKAIVRVSLGRLDELVRIIRDMIISRSVFEQNLRSLDRQIDDLHNATRRLQSISTKLEIDFEASLLTSGTPLMNQGTGLAPVGRGEAFDELEFDRYTEFHQSARELAETASDSFSINSSLDLVRGSLESVYEDQRRLLDDLQEKLMRIRMVEFGSISSRLQRVVRVTCEEEHKVANIRINNEKLEIDTHILDSFIEPLMHLLKNSVVHGIEDPETRRRLGKPETGLIEVSVENVDTHIVLTVSDDGRGISPDSLRRKAVSMGHISQEQADSLPDEEALELVFVAGLTTAEKLNLSAGRGVGMSIVRESIASNRGSVTIDSEFQKGTRFTLRMPLALAVTNVLLVRLAGQPYALPMKQITYIADLSEDMFTGLDGRKVEILEKKLPLLQLGEFIGNEPAPPASLIGMTAVLYESAEKSCVLTVDEVFGSEEVVIKPLLKPLDQIGGILGAALVGDGELVPILDLPALFRTKIGRHLSPDSAIQQKPKRAFDILVVDDSPSVRHLTSKVILAAGWTVKTAKDGIDALEVLKAAEALPLIILTDIEMPRMDGYELAASLQRSETFSSIPVIMITSRTADKHREKAVENGVSKYLTKPFEDRELVGAIRSLAEIT